MTGAGERVTITGLGLCPQRGPDAGFRVRAPRQGGQKGKPPNAEKLIAFICLMGRKLCAYVCVCVCV